MATAALLNEGRDPLAAASHAPPAEAPESGGVVVLSGLRLDTGPRIAELMAEAEESHEPVSPDSCADLVAFLRATPFTKRPGIFLLDNGNFLAVWKNGANEQAAFQFRGGGVVHCVFFYKRDSNKLPLSQETLIDLMANLPEKYPSFERLLNDEKAE